MQTVIKFYRFRRSTCSANVTLDFAKPEKFRSQRSTVLQRNRLTCNVSKNFYPIRSIQLTFKLENRHFKSSISNTSIRLICISLEINESD